MDADLIRWLVSNPTWTMDEAERMVLNANDRASLPHFNTRQGVLSEPLFQPNDQNHKEKLVNRIFCGRN